MKHSQKTLVKQDINFLENPMWMVNDKVTAKEYIIEKTNGTYKIKGVEGLPNKFDSVVLYYLLGKLLKKGNLENTEMVTTRYEIAMNVFYATESLGKTEYDRIMKSLKKWHGLTIEFSGTFYAEKEHTSRLFHIIDGVILNKKQQTLVIHFNKQYLQLLRHTKFCKYFDFNEYKKITGSISARLYEILIKSFKERPTWHIEIRNLAEKITLEKRPLAKDYYPSDVLIKLKPAIREVNEKTDFFINFEYDKETSLCTFKLTNQEKFKALAEIDNNLQKEAESAIIPAYKDPRDDALVRVLIAWDVPSDKARELLEAYGVEKVKHKLELLQNNQTGIKKPMAWLIKALEQDWDSHTYSKQLEKQKKDEEVARKRAEKEAQKKLLEKLKQEHSAYLENKVLELYKLLPPKIAKVYDMQFIEWTNQQKLKVGFSLPEVVYRIQYLKEILLEDSDCNFEEWAKAQLK